MAQAVEVVTFVSPSSAWAAETSSVARPCLGAGGSLGLRAWHSPQVAAGLTLGSLWPRPKCHFAESITRVCQAGPSLDGNAGEIRLVLIMLCY